jgi:hypothetical protein
VQFLHCAFFSGAENRKDSEKKIDKTGNENINLPFQGALEF